LTERTPRSRRKRLMALFALLLAIIIPAAIAAILYMGKMPGTSYAGALPAPSPLEAEISARLGRHIAYIAAQEHNTRNFAELERVAVYPEKTLSGLGYRVTRQEFSAAYGSSTHTVRNLGAEITGVSAPHQIVIVGAHYDSAPNTPGANDNGSGVAATLEIARLLKDHQPERTIRFVFFVNEEPPYYQTQQMGSLVYARRSRELGEKITAMLSLETLGYYSDARGSQHYPFPFNLFYPDTGNFLSFIGNVRSRDLVLSAIGSFRRHARFPSEGIAAPAFIKGIDWSDHWAFWNQGYPALMITDTAPFRYREYHTAEDTADKVDYERTARVVRALAEVTRDLGRAQPGG
jgi:Zn-dependent M28 family amino/carboxypeptidase